MATLVSALETQARRHLNEQTARFWSSAELVDIANNGMVDLWGSILDLYQEHYLTLDITNIAIAADTEALTGVPTDMFRVHLIEPKITSSAGAYRNLQFIPRDYNSIDFRAARSMGSVSPDQENIIFYAVTGIGAPVSAPSILIAPTLSSAIAAGNIRLAYNQSIAAKIASDSNPIPGGSDNALIAWIVAYARAKEREDRSPDANWLAVYATEKQNILTRLTPRQTQEPEVVESLFGEIW